MVAVAAHGQQEDVRQQSSDSAILLQAQPAKVATVQGHNPTRPCFFPLYLEPVRYTMVMLGKFLLFMVRWEVLDILSTTTTPTWLLSKKNTFNV